MKCKGKMCGAVNGLNHSPECKEEHDETVNVVPSCFERAEYNGRVFDNCMFFETCKSVKPICCNNPINLKETE